MLFSDDSSGIDQHVRILVFLTKVSLYFRVLRHRLKIIPKSSELPYCVKVGLFIFMRSKSHNMIIGQMRSIVVDSLILTHSVEAGNYLCRLKCLAMAIMAAGVGMM